MDKNAIKAPQRRKIPAMTGTPHHGAEALVGVGTGAGAGLVGDRYAPRLSQP